MQPKSIILKLNGWQRVWVIFSVLSLVATGAVVVSGLLNNADLSGNLSSEEVRWLYGNHPRNEVKPEFDSLFVRQIKFIITWFIAWLGTIGVAYAGGIAVAWVIKGFRHDQPKDSRGDPSRGQGEI